MRRISILGISIAVLVAAVTAPAAQAQTPALPVPEVDYCTAAPDVFMGWWFNEACRGHDECLAPLSGLPDVTGRLHCDRVFLADLLRAPHVLNGGTCAGDGVCGRVAFLYFAVVRFVTLFGDAAAGG